MEYSRPTFTPVFNPSKYNQKSTRPTVHKVQTFPAGIRVPFIAYIGDNSVQVQASEKTSFSYLTQNTQLSFQPFGNQNYVAQVDKVKSIYLPTKTPRDGYEIEIWNGQHTASFVLVSNHYDMYNVFYLPKGGKSILILPNQLVRLRFFEHKWSLLIF
jgi:hypothetical protein